MGPAQLLQDQRVAVAVTLKVTEEVGLQQIGRAVKFAPSAESRPPEAADSGSGPGSLRLPAGRLAGAHS